MYSKQKHCVLFFFFFFFFFDQMCLVHLSIVCPFRDVTVRLQCARETSFGDISENTKRKVHW